MSQLVTKGFGSRFTVTNGLGALQALNVSALATTASSTSIKKGLGVKLSALSASSVKSIRSGVSKMTAATASAVKAVSGLALRPVVSSTANNVKNIIAVAHRSTATAASAIKIIQAGSTSVSTFTASVAKALSGITTNVVATTSASSITLQSISSGTLRAWYDATDASSITQSGGIVSQWNDKSGNGNHVSQTTSANQPDYVSAGINGKGSINFGQHGVGTVLQNTSPSNLSGTTQTLFVVAKALTNADSGYGDMWVALSDLSSGQGYSMGLSYNQIALQYDGKAESSVGSFAAGDVILAAFDTTGNASAGYQNGTNIGGLGPSTSMFGSPQDICIGGEFFGGSSSTYYRVSSDMIGEIVIFDSSLSTSDRQYVEGYLAWKWGIQANLPSDHPYRNHPPAAGAVLITLGIRRLASVGSNVLLQQSFGIKLQAIANSAVRSVSAVSSKVFAAAGSTGKSILAGATRATAITTSNGKTLRSGTTSVAANTATTVSFTRAASTRVSATTASAVKAIRSGSTFVKAAALSAVNILRAGATKATAHAASVVSTKSAIAAKVKTLVPTFIGLQAAAAYVSTNLASSATVSSIGKSLGIRTAAVAASIVSTFQNLNSGIRNYTVTIGVNTASIVSRVVAIAASMQASTVANVSFLSEIGKTVHTTTASIQAMPVSISVGTAAISATATSLIKQARVSIHASVSSIASVISASVRTFVVSCLATSASALRLTAQLGLKPKAQSSSAGSIGAAVQSRIGVNVGSEASIKTSTSARIAVTATTIGKHVAGIGLGVIRVQSASIAFIRAAYDVLALAETPTLVNISTSIAAKVIATTAVICSKNAHISIVVRAVSRIVQRVLLILASMPVIGKPISMALKMSDIAERNLQCTDAASAMLPMTYAVERTIAMTEAHTATLTMVDSTSLTLTFLD